MSNRQLFKATGIEEGLCDSNAIAEDNYVSNVILPLSTFILASLYESPWGMLIFPQAANTPGDNSESRNLDSTLYSTSKEPRGHEKPNFLPLTSVSSSIQ